MKKSVLRGLVSLCLATVFIINANAIYVYRYEQEMSNWCWAASAQMIGHTKGRNVSQSAIVEYVMGSSVNVGANIDQCKQAVDYATLIYSTIAGSAIPYANAKSELDDGEPIFIRIQWNSGGGHAVVASGYNLSAGTITIVDPAVGCGTQAYLYRTMVSNCQFESGTGKWQNTITI